MKKTLQIIVTLALTAISNFASSQWAHQNINYLSNFDDASVAAEPIYGIRYQGCWGWRNTNDGREYGIIGSTSGTYFVEVTNPTNPIERDYVTGRSNNRIWHEYKSYQNYLYIISDGGGNSLQIVDMSYLPDSVHVVYDSDAIFDSGHTLYIDGNLLYVAYVSKLGMATSSMSVYSLADPELPVLLRRLDQDYPSITSVHDMYVINDTIFASCGNQGLYVFKYNATGNSFNQLGSLTSYPDAGYNHSSFLDASHQVLYMCDEVPAGMAVKVVDVSDISNMIVVDTFYSNPGATPHNPYVLRNELFLSYYQDGVVAYNLDNPRHPVNNGYFDTHYQNTPGTYPTPAYQGCWGAYTDLPSGHLLASDMQLGLFVLVISQVMSTGPIIEIKPTVTLYPNPAYHRLHINLPSSSYPRDVSIINATGNLILSSEIEGQETIFDINTSKYASGIYQAIIKGNEGVSTYKFVVVN